MSRPGAFKKGEKKPNQGKRGPCKATLRAREAVAMLVEGNIDRMQGWLDEIAKKQGAAVAWRCMMDVLEYHIPKLARTEVSASGAFTMTHETTDAKARLAHLIARQAATE